MYSLSYAKWKLQISAARKWRILVRNIPDRNKAATGVAIHQNKINSRGLGRKKLARVALTRSKLEPGFGSFARATPGFTFSHNTHTLYK